MFELIRNTALGIMVIFWCSIGQAAPSVSCTAQMTLKECVMSLQDKLNQVIEENNILQRTVSRLETNAALMSGAGTVRKQTMTFNFSNPAIAQEGFPGLCAGAVPPYYFELEIFNANKSRRLKVNGYRRVFLPSENPGLYGLDIFFQEEQSLRLGSHNAQGTVNVMNFGANEELTAICKLFNIQ
ncbi:MAG: hypothetical protein HQK50_14450 [Oligoflexia bacterium]|nr:hypothetical protein [Oligoflexia bacterium]MBF0366771.1 hypothetical protein [Oligoflexia bacterium]